MAGTTAMRYSLPIMRGGIDPTTGQPYGGGTTSAPANSAYTGPSLAGMTQQQLLEQMGAPAGPNGSYSPQQMSMMDAFYQQNPSQNTSAYGSPGVDQPLQVAGSGNAASFGNGGNAGMPPAMIGGATSQYSGLLGQGPPSSPYGSSTNVTGNSNAAPGSLQSQVSMVQNPSMNSAVNAYTNEVEQSLQPTFDRNIQDMSAQEAAMGILGSGSGAQNLQDVTAQDNATLAGAVAPLISQGYAQQNSNAQLNANAANAYLGQLTGIGSTQSMFDANLNNTDSLANMQAQNALQLAQLGYANQDYQGATSQYGGLLSQGLSSLGSIVGNGMNNAFSGYTLPQTANLPYSSQAGYGSGYGSGSGSSTYDPLGGGYVDPNTYNPYPGGTVVNTPGSGEGQDPTQPVNVSGGDGSTPTFTDPSLGTA